MCGRTRPPRLASRNNLRLTGELDFWFGCDCCAVGILQPAGPDDPPDLLRGKEVRLVWEVDALFAWTLDEFEDYLANERVSLPTTPRTAAVEELGLPVTTSRPTACGVQRSVRRSGRRAVPARSTQASRSELAPPARAGSTAHRGAGGRTGSRPGHGRRGWP